jgi:hypothetical protein
VSYMRHFRPAFVALALLAGTSIIDAAPMGRVEGEYDCDECHGFLTIQRVNPSEVKVSLAIGGGSCAGEPPVTGKVRDTGGVLKVPYKLGRKQCFAQIELTERGAVVTDSCVMAQDEEHSTCATLGSYTRRKK